MGQIRRDFPQFCESGQKWPDPVFNVNKKITKNGIKYIWSKMTQFSSFTWLGSDKIRFSWGLGLTCIQNHLNFKNTRKDYCYLNLKFWQCGFSLMTNQLKDKWKVKSFVIKSEERKLANRKIQIIYLSININIFYVFTRITAHVACCAFSIN